MLSHLGVVKLVDNCASEANPTLGCSIEISDVGRSVGMSVVYENA